MLRKKGVLKNFAKITGKTLHQSLFLNKVAKILVQGFSCEYCKFFESIFFYRTTPVAASSEKERSL